MFKCMAHLCSLHVVNCSELVHQTTIHRIKVQCAELAEELDDTDVEEYSSSSDNKTVGMESRDLHDLQHPQQTM